MHRTTVMLPEDLKTRASELASRQGVSLGELIRRSLEAAVEAPQESRAADPLLADDATFQGETPRDLARHHDHYLYDEDP